MKQKFFLLCAMVAFATGSVFAETQAEDAKECKEKAECTEKSDCDKDKSDCDKDKKKSDCDSKEKCEG